jgi:hypothetical protein
LRHLHDKVKVLDDRTAPPPEETVHADQAAAAMYGGMGMMGDTLMITNSAYSKLA